MSPEDLFKLVKAYPDIGDAIISGTVAITIAIISALATIGSAIFISLSNIKTRKNNDATQEKLSAAENRFKEKNFELQTEIGKTQKKLGITANEISMANATLQSVDNQKNRISTYISDNRMDWIERLRNLMSEYLSCIGELKEKKPTDMQSDCERYMSAFDRIRLITAKIRLHLNYSGNADFNLMAEIYQLNRIIEIIIIFKLEDVNYIDELGFKANAMDYLKLQSMENYYMAVMNGRLIKKLRCDIKWDKLFENDFEATVHCFEYYIIQLEKFLHLLNLREELLILYTESYLKVEWERVKFEVANGNSQFMFDEKYVVELSKREDEFTFINLSLQKMSVAGKKAIQAKEDFEKALEMSGWSRMA